MNLPVQYEEAMKAPRVTSLFARGRFDSNMQASAERQFALQILQKNEELQRCTPESVAMCLLDASYSGLSLSPTLAHAYLIPYKDQCTFSPGYRGLMHLAYRAGTIKSVQVNLVHRNDPVFRVWTDESGRHIRHEETRGEPGDVTHAYCIAYPMAGGPPIIEVMNANQLAAIEKAATSRKKGGMVWRGPFRDEMCKKAVIRRASKFWPKDGGGVIEHMMAVTDKYEGMDFPGDADADRDNYEAEECLSADQIADIEGALQDQGIPGTVTGEWLRRYAERLGYGAIEHVPGRLYETAKKELVDYARNWSKARRDTA